jgi:hypothetical protein
MPMLRSKIGCAVPLATLIVSQTALAQQPESKPPPANLGNLTCTLGEKIEQETAAGSAQSVLCLFHLSAANTEELYVGIVHFSGPEETRGDVSLSWIVKGPSEATAVAGGLEQSYTAQGGGSADPENSVPLVGQQSDTIALYPLALPADEVDSKKTAAARKIAVLELKLKTTVT